jgi:hypothetical protein
MMKRVSPPPLVPRRPSRLTYPSAGWGYRIACRADVLGATAARPGTANRFGSVVDRSALL